MELQILYALQNLHSPILDKLMLFFTTLGNMGWFWILLAFLFILFDKKDRSCGWQMGIALVLSLLISNILLKNIVARDRPCWMDPSVQLLISIPKDYSFPSGHSSASMAAALSLFMHHRRLGIAALILALIIAFSRLYLFVHWPTDVLAGLLIGIFCAVAAGKTRDVSFSKKGTHLK